MKPHSPHPARQPKKLLQRSMDNINPSCPLSVFSKIDDQILVDIVDRVAQDKCIAFAGAGISKGSGLPKWDELIDSLLNYAKSRNVDHVTTAFIQEYVKKGDLITAAELIQRSLTSRNEFLEQTALIVKNASPKAPRGHTPHQPMPNDVHYLLTRLGFEKIITTNYDDLLEKSSDISQIYDYKPLRRRPNDESTLDQKLTTSDKCIIKIHGSIDDPSTLILTRSGYLKAYSGGFINSWIRSNLISTSFLFIGYSLNDFDILNLIRDAKSSVSPHVSIGPHFAILNEDGFHSIYAEYLKECFTIHPIPLDLSAGSNEVRQFLVRLHGMVALRTIKKENFTIRHYSYFTDTMESICTKLRTVVGADYLCLFMLEGVDSTKLRQAQLWSSSTSVSTSHQVDVPRSIYELFLRLRAAQYYHSDAKDAQGAELGISTEVSSLLVLPVFSQAKKLGLLVIGSRISNAYTEDHLEAAGLYTKAIADVFIECRRKIDAVESVANQMSYKFINDFLSNSRIIHHSRPQISYIWYSIDYHKGKLKPFCDGKYGGGFELDFSEEYLATMVLNSGSTLRFASPNDAIKAFPIAEKNIRRGLEHYGVKGNLFLTPIRSYGHISSVFVAWNGKAKKGTEFHSTAFNRAKRLVRLFMNDYRRGPTTMPESGAAQEFIRVLESKLAQIDGRKLWGTRIANRRFQMGVIHAALESLVHEVTGLYKARLWLTWERHERGTDRRQQLFEIVSSYCRKEAKFHRKKLRDGYVTGKPLPAGDPYTLFTISRFKSDPYARFQKPSEFDEKDRNAKDLDKDPDGRWIAAPVVFGHYEDARLVGCLSCDSHIKIKGKPSERTPEDPRQEDFQRCAVDVITHVLAPILNEMAIRRSLK